MPGYVPSPYDGDLMLVPTMDGGDIIITGGQPQMDDGIWTAVYVSLFGADYWGNAIATSQSQVLNSRVEAILNGKWAGLQTMNAVQQAALDALAWMITDGVATAVTAVGAITAPNTIMLTVGITQPGSGPAYQKYQLNWSNQQAQVQAMGAVFY
jgi:phage gp46-like protein